MPVGLEQQAPGETAAHATTTSFSSRGAIPAVVPDTSQTQSRTASERGYGDGEVDEEGEKHIQHCLMRINEYRAAGKPPRAPLKEHRPLTVFAIAGTAERAAGGPAHGHIAKSFENGGTGPAAPKGLNAKTENQGFASGEDIDKCIDTILELMMAEGPGGAKRNHYDNIMDPQTQLVGIGLLVGTYKDVKGVWLTNDFLGTGMS